MSGAQCIGYAGTARRRDDNRYARMTAVASVPGSHPVRCWYAAVRPSNRTRREMPASVSSPTTASVERAPLPSRLAQRAESFGWVAVVSRRVHL